MINVLEESVINSEIDPQSKLPPLQNEITNQIDINEEDNNF
jgi:hypothetical protein